ncbi:MAG: EAL domain-containing protein [Campylobacterota bacterium]|nr:EAL domain-containing protein [Campylobacterota bacterium]
MDGKNISKIRDIVGKYTVLIVEDDVYIQKQLSRFLEKVFKKAYIAVDGLDGLNKYNDNKIDMIVTDIRMPNVDGLEMIEMIRKSNKDVPILVLSAHSETDYFMKSISLGVDGYLQKPIDVNLLIDLVRKVVLKIKLQDELLESTSLLNQYKEAVDKNAIVSKTDNHGVITYVNDKFCETSKYSRDELVGQSHSIIKHPDNPEKVYKEIWQTIKKEKKIWHGTLMNLDKNQEAYYMDSTIKPLLDIDGNILEYISMRTDISEVVSPLRSLKDTIRFSTVPIVVMMQIEYFDDIEKFYGIEISEKIEKKINDDFFKIVENRCEFDKIYSLGDGLYALAKDKKNCQFTLEQMTGNLQRVQKSIASHKFEIDSLEYSISMLMSVSYGDNVLSNVKYGLSQLKGSDQNFILANGLKEIEFKKSQKNLEILTMVKNAINNLKIISYFQPIINNKTKKIEKFESLVRLIDEKGKVVSPFVFLDIAKKGNYYSQITSMVLENSFTVLATTDCEISINLSIQDIEQEYTRKKIYSFLEKHRRSLHRLVFELLEDETVKNFDVVTSFIDDVKKMGVKIAIDDFGVGHSNFERLLDYQPDILKIDGSLIKHINTNPLHMNIVETIVSFAKKENIKTIAEFVENEDIFNTLKELRVDYSQGYYFGKPDLFESYSSFNGFQKLIDF